MSKFYLPGVISRGCRRKNAKPHKLEIKIKALATTGHLTPSATGVKSILKNSIKILITE